MARVLLNKVWKRYGDVEAVRDLNLNCVDKEFFCLLGPSGCGKSSTLRMIAGLEEISEGEISIGDRVVNQVEPKDRDIAMVFESYALYPHKTVFENMAFPLRCRKDQYDSNTIKERVQRAGKILEITELLQRYPRQLSGGQKQRVAIGRAIVREPQVFLMDEPISHLDAKLRTHMRGELKHMQKSLGSTMIYVTHDQLEAMSMADQIAVMRRGVLQQAGTPHEIFHRPVNIFVAGFVGEPPMNFIDCEMNVDGERTFLRNQDFNLELPDVIKQRLSACGNSIADTHKMVVGLRPEHFKISSENKGLNGDAFASEVYVTEPLGEDQIVDVTVNGTKVKIRAPLELDVRMGDKVWLQVDKNKMHLFDRQSEVAYI